MDILVVDLSISTSTVPHQWKLAAIQPVPKVPTASQHADFRHIISITPVLNRTLERIFVRKFLYPAHLTPPPSLTFSDQYAFRPTGSTSADLIAILQFITDLLSDNQLAIVLALDFSKAFDTIRHSTLLNKMAPWISPMLPIIGWWTSSWATGTVQGMAEPRPQCLTSLLA